MHWYFEVIIRAHCVEKKGHTAPAVCRLSQCPIDFARSDNRFGVRSAHPVDGCMYLVIGDVRAMAHNHGLSPTAVAGSLVSYHGTRGIVLNHFPDLPKRSLLNLT